ncbi:hypothetical protein AB8989_14690 [Yersinia hibernica]|uniref:hypothetical protein n=1 Tax=Yersinia hibernica TaxID=2339259 RepID=UPI003CFF6AA6
MNWSIIKIQIMTVILLGGFVVLLLFKISSLFNQNEKQKVALAIVQDKNEQLEDAINTFKLNESENWVVTQT